MIVRYFDDDLRIYRFPSPFVLSSNGWDRPARYRKAGRLSQRFEFFVSARRSLALKAEVKPDVMEQTIVIVEARGATIQ